MVFASTMSSRKARSDGGVMKVSGQYPWSSTSRIEYGRPFSRMRSRCVLIERSAVYDCTSSMTSPPRSSLTSASSSVGRSGDHSSSLR